MFARITVLAILLPLLAACARPYATPEIRLAYVESDRPLIEASPFAGFEGIASTIKSHDIARVIWVHGGCLPGLAKLEERSREMNKALDGLAVRHTTDDRDRRNLLEKYQIDTVDGSVELEFFHYAELQNRIKVRFDSDRDSTVERATLNQVLKTNIVNECVADAFIYGGRNGSDVRKAGMNTMCLSLGGAFNARTRHCSFPNGVPTKPVIVVAVSFGTKVAIDSLRMLEAVPSNRNRDFYRAVSNIRTVFLISNQLNLFDLLGAPPEMPASQEQNSAAALQDLLTRARLGARQASWHFPTPSIVSFTDPNDMLSYELDPVKTSGPPNRKIVRPHLVNVYVSNDTTIMGAIENPISAHCGYFGNEAVVGLIVDGYQLGNDFPMGHPLEKKNCYVRRTVHYTR